MFRAKAIRRTTRLRAKSARTRGDTRALCLLGSTSDLDTRELPVRARARATEEVDVSTARDDRTSNSVECEISNGNTSGGDASRRAVLVVLLNDNTVLPDAAEGDVLVRDVVDGARGARDGLDAHAVVRVADRVALDVHVLDRVV